jgi:hypothetical protein
LLVIFENLKTPARRRQTAIALGGLAIFFAIGLVRAHGRTAILAYEALTGKRTAASEDWGMTKREREAETVARRVRERIGAGEPLYIWDYALDVYWLSGCRPASRYLTPAYLTGDFSNSNTDFSDARADANNPFWAEAHRNFIADLKQRRPRIILDMSDTFLSLPYKEITEFIEENYERDEEIGVEPGRPFVVYILK